MTISSSWFVVIAWSWLAACAVIVTRLRPG